MMDALGITLQNIPRQLLSETLKLIPHSMWLKLLCCVIHDGHPRDIKRIDITICLEGGTVIELFQKELISSIKLNVSYFKEIRMIRNNDGDLFYLVAGDQDVILLSTIGQLSEYRRFSNVRRYEICDPECSGQAMLKIVSESSRFHISLSDLKSVIHETYSNLAESKPVISALKKKLIEAKYNLECHEKAYKQIESLRQQASYLCHGDGVLQPKFSHPKITFCNMKIVIELQLENVCDKIMNKVFVLIHNSSCNAISYTSKVYEYLTTSPFYKENENREIKSKCRASAVAVIPIREFEGSISSRIDFNVIVSYDVEGKNYLQSFDDVNISAGDVMGKNFDVFNNPKIDVHSIILAMISTTVKTELCLKGFEDMYVQCLPNVLCKYLDMDFLGERKTVAIHKKSPHHILHGIMIIFDEELNDIENIRINISIDVYTRSPSQVMALIHFINDKVPIDVVIITPSIQVIPHGDSQEAIDSKDHNYNYTESAISLLKQSSITLDYMDNCLNKMGQSNNLDKNNIQIDLFAVGDEEFCKYRSDMLTEAENCFQRMMKPSTSNCDQVMEID